MASSRGPLLLYVLPLLSVLVLGVSTFLGTDGVAVRSAMVLGGPTDSDQPFRGRLQVVEETHGVATPVGGESVLLRAEQGTQVVERRLVTDASGWTEFELPLGASPPFELTVLDRLGRPLVRGRPVLETERWRRSARVRGGQLGFRENGLLEARVSIENGVLAVPFTGQGVLSLLEEGKPLVGATVELRGEGATLRTPSRGMTDTEGKVTFEVAPEHHVSILEVSVRRDDQRWEFEQVLPVVPGAYGLTRRKGRLVVRAPVPRDEVWFTFVTETQRFSGGRIDLREDAEGFFSGEIPAAAVPESEGLFVNLSSSADGRSPSTVGYPLDGQGHTLDIWDGYLLDGAKEARSRAEARRRKVRFTLAAYAGLSGLLTLLLFVLRVRSAGRILEQRLEGVGATKETFEKSPVPLLIAVLGLFFAFSAGVLWIVAR